MRRASRAGVALRPGLLGALIMASLLIGAPRAWAVDPPAPVPIQDNELLVGLSAGALLVTEQPDRDAPRYERRLGGACEFAFIGLMNRATDWLDAELALGVVGLWLADGGFTQADGARVARRALLPGARARASVVARPAWAAPLRAGLGVAASLFAAPAIGTLGRLEVEASLGLDLARAPETHWALDLVYGLPAIDGLVETDGLPLVGLSHRLELRLGYGF